MPTSEHDSTYPTIRILVPAFADVNAEKMVDGVDLAAVLGEWGDAPRNQFPPSDCPLNLGPPHVREGEPCSQAQLGPSDAATARPAVGVVPRMIQRPIWPIAAFTQSLGVVFEIGSRFDVRHEESTDRVGFEDPAHARAPSLRIPR